MSAITNRSPIKFDPEVEQAYSRDMLERLVLLSRMATILGALAFVGYQFWDFLLESQAISSTGPLRLAVVIYLLACTGLSYLPALRTDPKFWPFFVLFIYLGVAVGFALILSRLPGGFSAGIGGFLLGMIFIPVLVIGPVQAVGVLVPYFAVILLIMSLTGASQFEIINTIAWTGGGVGFSIGFAYLLDVINRRSFHLEQLLETEKQRSEDLLLNILPAEIASRLKADEDPIADSFESVTVLFADLSGFTDLSRTMPATKLVKLLNDLFSRFDSLAEKHGVEKIKTIGDAYMAVSGLTDGEEDHAGKIADLALGMQEAFHAFRRENNVDLKLRIGTHSGAVVAGVIGKQKFAYDLWGDTVNIASRMESEGIPDQIQISAETWKLLSTRYQSTLRGEIQIKGHSARTTYLLQGRL